MSESAVVVECAAFLTGTLAEQLEAQGQSVPAWAWTNLLAHGSETLILESISRPFRYRLLARNWWMARADLAEMVLDITHWSSSLLELQESVLIPLELDLASRPEISVWSPRQWQDAVTIALRHQNHTDRTS
jgi:dTDP-4-dehydrorhamnose reductase